MVGGQPRKIDPELEKLKKDPRAVPPEVIEHFGDFHLVLRNGYLYALLTKSQRPRGFFGRYLPVSRLVWCIHNPDYIFDAVGQIRYVDGDTFNNSYENLLA